MSESDKVLRFEDREVEVDGKTRVVLVARPGSVIRLDQRRLERMRAGDLVSRVDMDILAAVGSRARHVDVVVFDANAGDPDANWGFEADLDDEDRMGLGFFLLRSQIDLYRELVRLGASGVIGVGFGSRELATLQRATVRIVTELSAELESADAERAKQLEIDLWLIEHAATWTGLALDEYLTAKLAEETRTRAGNRAEIDALLSAAPDA